MTANILWLSAMSVRPPRVRTHSFSPFVCHIYFLGFRVVIGLRLVAQPHPSQPASCDFCSSDQRFACTFLQIPPHGGHPWCSVMTFPLLGQSRDFHPLECAHAGRTHKETPPGPACAGSGGVFLCCKCTSQRNRLFILLHITAPPIYS